MKQQIAYVYWTGNAWVPAYVEVDGPMAVGWHIFHVVIAIVTWGLWLPFYLVCYLISLRRYKAEVAGAEDQIQRYYRKVGRGDDRS